MTQAQFEKAVFNRYYKDNLSLEAARLVLVKGYGVREAAREVGVSAATVSQAVNKLKSN